ncbi:hypothetical protein ACU18_08540 [Arthrobacter sp. ZBG10]|uniref:hypothetical protein n=1 Tax=Arthrobacter sp. ZBG10 TaxID=1676590 RepID=UPI000682107F|nr:hypothetical protein [Arthrobacter sp. ZBG10]KNH18034.1 hypothetical protein ACU18_08540 [Arthrobacter sp. ZBG10]
MNRTARTRIACVVTAALAVTWGGPAANAYWQALGSNAGAARADSLQAVAAPIASASAGAASVSWQQGTTAAGRPVARYTVARYPSAAGGTKVAAGGACAGNIDALTCTEAALPAGTWYYTVTPVLGAWAGAESARSLGVAAADTTPPPTPTISAPALITSSTVGGVQVSGNAEPLSSVTITAKDAGAVHSVPKTVSADSLGQWSAVMDLTTLNDPTVTYSVVATDAAGNVSVVAGTATSSKDTTAPTAKVTLVNNGTQGTAEKGDAVTIQFSKPMNLSSICSTWVTGQQPPDASASGDVVVTITGTNLTVSRTLAGCTFNIGTVSLGATYANSGTLTFEGSGGNASKIAWNNNNQTLTITLGQRGGSAKTGVATSSPTVTPPQGVTDANGNQAVGAAASAPSRF